MSEEDFDIRDKWMFYTLVACGFPPKEIRVEFDQALGQKLLVFRFAECARVIYDKKMRGEKIPIEDIGLVENAERIFKNNLHRLYTESNSETRSGSNS